MPDNAGLRGNAHQPVRRSTSGSNQALIEITREEIKDRVPSYVFQTQDQYMECPQCHRLYWQGTHRQAMTHKLEQL
ncbi:Mut7-C RNAse domain-containing protein [Bacteroidota bacterium]